MRTHAIVEDNPIRLFPSEREARQQAAAGPKLPWYPVQFRNGWLLRQGLSRFRDAQGILPTIRAAAIKRQLAERPTIRG